MTITAPTPNGFVYAWIDTGLPGARKMTIDGSDYTAAENYVQADAWVGLLNTAISAGGHSIAFSTTTGLVTLTLSSSLACEWADQTGYICGFDREPGVIETFSSLTSRVVPPGMTWLAGATWEEIEISADQELQVVRHRRGYGYRFGGNRIFRVTLTMHKESLSAFDGGWASTGKITVYAGESSPLSDSDAGGQIVGHVLGIQNISWLGPTAEYAELTILLARAL